MLRRALTLSDTLCFAPFDLIDSVPLTLSPRSLFLKADNT